MWFWLGNFVLVCARVCAGKGRQGQPCDEAPLAAQAPRERRGALWLRSPLQDEAFQGGEVRRRDAAGLHTAEVGAGGDVAENGEGASSFDAAAFGEGLTLPEIVWGQDDAVLFVTLKQMQCANPSAANGEASHRVLHITTGVVALSCAGRGAVLHLREAIDPSASRCSTSFGGDEACYLTKAQPHAFDRLLRDADDPVRRSRPAGILNSSGNVQLPKE